MPDELLDEQPSENAVEENQNSETSDGEGEKETPDYQAKAKAFYAKNKELAQKLKEAEEKVAKLSPTKVESPDIPVKVYAGLKKDGFSDQEILDLSEQASSLGLTPDKLLANPVFKAGIESQREKAKKESAIPTPSHRSPVVNGKTWSEMTPDERKANFSEFSKGILK